jgi:hypothetical protein
MTPDQFNHLTDDERELRDAAEAIDTDDLATPAERLSAYLRHVGPAAMLDLLAKLANARAESAAHQTARVAAEERRDNLAQLASDVLGFLEDRRRGDPPTTREDHADEDSAVALLRAAVRTRETPPGEEKA